MEDEEPGRYTLEQKLVSAVWVHEKAHNNQKWKDIHQNFRIRFNMPSPKRATLQKWEKKLFSTGSLLTDERLGRPCARLMHVPYVKASLHEQPHLSLRERSKILGLPRSTLLKILRDDLKIQDGETLAAGDDCNDASSVTIKKEITDEQEAADAPSEIEQVLVKVEPGEL